MRRLTDHPNEHISQLHTEVELLSRKVEPLLKRVEEAAANVRVANSRSGPLGMLSKMGARMINFYADDLAEMLLQDFLGETALELQRIEQKTGKAYSNEEAQMCAEMLLKNLTDYQAEEANVSLKWTNPAMKGQKLKGHKTGQPLQPAAISFNLNEDL